MTHTRTIGLPALAVIAARWKMIAACAVIGALLAFAMTYLAQPSYRAEATIYALPGRGTSVTAALRDLNLGGAAGDFTGQSATTAMASYLVSVLRSHAVAAKVCGRLDLAREPRFAAAQPISQWALAEVLRRSVTAKGDLGGLITIRATARDPQLVFDIANAYLAALDDFMSTTAGSKRRFIERQLDQARVELASLERELRAYQSRHQSYDLDVEAKELIQNWARLSAEKQAAQVALRENAGVIEVSGSIDNLVTLRSQRAGLQARSSELGQLERELGRRLAALPEVGLGMARLQRRVAAKQALAEMLESQLEMARISEVEEQARYQVIDRAYPPERPVWPRRKLSAAAGLAAGLMVGLLWAYALGMGREVTDAGS